MNKYRKALDKLTFHKQSQEEGLLSEERKRRECVKLLKQAEKAKEVIREVGIRTQQQIQYHISDVTSLAMQAVFPDPYTLEVEFVQRRNKTECDIYFARNGNRVDPLNASGGGVVDVASLALRVASWSLMSPRTRSTIIQDEPMRFVSSDLQERAGEMVSEISRKLGLQFIMITHEESLTIHADKVHTVRRNKKTGRSTCC